MLDRVDFGGIKDVDHALRALIRQRVILQSRTRLMPFVRFVRPDPEDPEDATRSTYRNQKFHDAIADALEQFERGDEVKQLIFCCPPRHGKTELACKSFAAWFHGRHPEQDVAVCTYAGDLALDMGADVRAIVASKNFQQVFPGYELRKGGKAKDNIVTTRRGRMVFKGRGEALTGRGANCLPRWVKVLTPTGEINIGDVLPGQEVISYDEKSRKCVIKKVQAVACRPRSRLYRLTDTSGRVVELTGDHRVFSKGTWTAARELAAGDDLLCALQRGGGENVSGREETPLARPPGFLLLERMLGEGAERSAVRSQGVCELRQGSAEKRKDLRHTGTGPDVLLGSVHGAVPGGKRKTTRRGLERLQALQGEILPGASHGLVLQSELCRAEILEQARGGAVEGAEATGAETRRQSLRSLPVGRKLRSAPPGWGPEESQLGKPADLVRGVPRGPSHFTTSRSAVLTVEKTDIEDVVYDIQVEDTECFFANGILVHNCLILDDLFKDFEEARSQTIRDQAWNWFTKVAMTRRMGKKLVIIIMTRWHTDDVIGRITDPNNPHYSEAEAKKWKIINLPLLAEEDDPLGRPVGQPLWPEEYDEEYAEGLRNMDPLGFAALQQQRPTVADGTLFRRENIRYYSAKDLPEVLRFYGASDHAVGLKQRNDLTCLLRAGVDVQDNIYLTDCVWGRYSTVDVVEFMLEMFRGNMAPLFWWAEKGHITQSIGPFLHKRMQETNTYGNIVECTPIADKQARSQSFAARVAMGKVFFPKDAPWTEKAVNQLLEFPNGTFDDFVDAGSWLGKGLGGMHAPEAAKPPKKEPAYGTLDWVKMYDAHARMVEADAYGDGM